MKLFLVSTDTYKNYSRFVDTKHNNIYNKVYHTIRRLKEDDATKASHSVEDLLLKFHVCYPVLSASDAEALTETLSQLSAATVEPGQASELLGQLKRRKLATDIALLAVEVGAGESDFQALQKLIQETEDENDVQAEDSPFVSDDILVIRDRFVSQPPFRFRVKTLNAILGGLHRKTFGFIFARPEIGKTQFIASEAAFLAPQVESCVLWINNEEEGTALVTRCYQAALEKDADWIFKHAEEARKQYISKIAGKIKIYDRPTASDRDIRSVIRDTKPDVIFIDQLDKVRGFSDVEDGRYDLLQKAKYQWGREIAKEFNCAVIGICQAGGTAEGKKYLDMNDVDSSKTGKQGEADWMFGLGRSDRLGEEDSRFISVCKNKLPHCPAMVQGMRHAKVPIRSVPEFQIYEDVLNVS